MCLPILQCLSDPFKSYLRDQGSKVQEFNHGFRCGVIFLAFCHGDESATLDFFKSLAYQRGVMSTAFLLGDFLSLDSFLVGGFR